MSDYHICHTCGEITPNDEMLRDRTYVPEARREIVYLHCPCGSEDVEEAMRCDGCEEVLPLNMRIGLCTACEIEAEAEACGGYH